VSGLRSGELARAAGVNPQTLRYYERRGLLAEPERTLGGHRVYRPLAAGCDDLVECAERPECPVPFSAGAERPIQHRASIASVSAVSR
jgi:hypothetical protein